MTERISTLTRKFVKYSYGTDRDYQAIKKRLRNMDWISRTKEVEKMREIISNV